MALLADAKVDDLLGLAKSLRDDKVRTLVLSIVVTMIIGLAGILRVIPTWEIWVPIVLAIWGTVTGIDLKKLDTQKLLKELTNAP